MKKFYSDMDLKQKTKFGGRWIENKLYQLPLSLIFFPEEYVKDAPLGKEMTIPVCKEFFSGNELKQVWLI